LLQNFFRLELAGVTKEEFLLYPFSKNMSGGSTGERPFTDILTSIRYWIIKIKIDKL